MTATLEKTASDLTLLRDPSKVWPDALACPDFPYQGVNGRWSREDAEARLLSIGAAINADGALRAPSADEVAALEEQFFTVPEPGTSSGKVQRLADLGYPGLRPKPGEAGSAAHRIAEATHLRGYLRKLQVEADQKAAEQSETTARRLRSTVDAFTAMARASEAELASLREAEERHLARIADAQARGRAVALRSALQTRYTQAREAARELGEDAPALPKGATGAAMAFMPNIAQQT